MLDDTVYKSGTLQKSVLLCPNVTNMELNMFEKQILEETDLKRSVYFHREKSMLLEIKNTELEYSNNAKTFIGINRLPFVGVVPLIKTFGCNLKKQFFE